MKVLTPDPQDARERVISWTGHGPVRIEAADLVITVAAVGDTVEVQVDPQHAIGRLPRLDVESLAHNVMQTRLAVRHTGPKIGG